MRINFVNRDRDIYLNVKYQTSDVRQVRRIHERGRPRLMLATVEFVTSPGAFDRSGKNANPAFCWKLDLAVQAGAPVPQFRVRFIGGAVTRAVQVTGESCSLELLSGQYFVTVVNPPDGYNVVSIMDGAD
jgi:hypothetical protein